MLCTWFVHFSFHHSLVSLPYLFLAHWTIVSSLFPLFSLPVSVLYSKLIFLGHDSVDWDGFRDFLAYCWNVCCFVSLHSLRLQTSQTCNRAVDLNRIQQKSLGWPVVLPWSQICSCLLVTEHLLHCLSSPLFRFLFFCSRSAVPIRMTFSRFPLAQVPTYPYQVFIPRCRTALFHSPFYSRTPNLWNTLFPFS